MAVKKPRSGGTKSGTAKKTALKSKPAVTAKKATKGVKASKQAAKRAGLTKEQAALLVKISNAPEADRFDLISKADRDVVAGLLKTKRIHVREIQKPVGRGTIPVGVIRAAVKSAKQGGGIVKVS